jgi:hypothetical protein
LEKPAALKLNVGNILENGDISFLQMAGKLIPKCVVSHHRQQYCSCTRTAYSVYDWKPLTQPYLVWLRYCKKHNRSFFMELLFISMTTHWSSRTDMKEYLCSKSGFDMLKLKSVGVSLLLLQLQVLKATMQSMFLDNYHLLFTFTIHGHTVTNTPVPLNRTLSCLKLHSIWIMVCKTGSSML